MSDRVLIIAPARQGKTSLALSLLSRNAPQVFYYTNNASVRLRGRGIVYPENTLVEHLSRRICGNIVVDNVTLPRLETVSLMCNIYNERFCRHIVTVNTVKQIAPDWMNLFTTVYVGHVTNARDLKLLTAHFGRVPIPRPKEFTVITRNVYGLVISTHISTHPYVATRRPWINITDMVNYHRVIKFSPLWTRMPKDLKVYLRQFIVEWDF